MNRWRLFVLLFALAAFLPACARCPLTAPGRSASAVPESKARPWTSAGLEDHPEMAALVEAGDPWGLGFRPATTSWRPWSAPVVDDFGPGGNRGRRHNPALLLHDFAGELPLAGALGTDCWQVITRVFLEEPDRALGTVFFWGLKDDSVAGVDYRLAMERMGDRWSVSAVVERTHCRRGIGCSGSCL